MGINSPIESVSASGSAYGLASRTGYHYLGVALALREGGQGNHLKESVP